MSRAVPPATPAPDVADTVPVETPDTAEWLIDLRFPARPQRLKLVRGTVMQAALVCGCDGRTAHDVVIAVDEACQNIIRHAYAGEPGDIELRIRCAPGEIVLRLRDFADPVDAERVRPRDLDDLRPGGLGTHFIREVMDSVTFLRPGDGQRGNVLRMVRRFGAADGKPTTPKRP